MESERIVFVEFYPTPKRSTRAYEVITRKFVEGRGGRPGYIDYNWYDCAYMKDGTLIYNCSGGGGLNAEDTCPVRGPYWVDKSITVPPNDHRRVKRLPRHLREWPPAELHAIEARVVHCSKCGNVPDYGYCDVPCEHLTLDTDLEEWVEV